MKKTAIVVGATGLVGSEVVNCLVAAEHIEKVITITRRATNHASCKVHNHVVDFERLSAYPELFTGDILFSCLGTTRAQAKSIEAQRRVDLDYQYCAAQLAARNGVDHYLLVSSSGANSSSLSPYLKMKGELEERVQSLDFAHISIFQPSLLIGERRDARLGEGMAAKIMPGLCKLPGLRRYRPISGRDVALKMVAASRCSSPGLERFKLDEVFPD